MMPNLVLGLRQGGAVVCVQRRPQELLRENVLRRKELLYAPGHGARPVQRLYQGDRGEEGASSRQRV